MSLALTYLTLDLLWPKAAHSLVDGIVATSEAVFSKYKIATEAELVDFLAQISEETGGGVELEENLIYSATRLCQVWPSKFPSLAAAAPYANNPSKLANYVYGGRCGNIPGTQDGWNFRGRGLIQLTFRSNYSRIGAATGLDVVNNPDLVNDPIHALECAAAYWFLANVSPFADRGDFAGETKVINGGLTNFDLREQWRDQVKRILALPSLERGSPTWAQAALTLAGFNVGAIDGVFGNASRRALALFQRAHGIQDTGELDVASIAALAPFVDSQVARAAPQAVQPANASPKTESPKETLLTIPLPPAAAPPRVTPTVSQSARIDWGSWLEQAMEHETPIVEAVARGALGLALHSIPFGAVVSMFIGPTVINQYVDQALKALEDLVKNKSLTIPAPNAVENMVVKLINDNEPALAKFLGDKLDPMIKAAVAKLGPGI